MDTDKVYHYVYRITNTVENKHYYGKRSSKIEPIKDIGIRYFSSSRDKTFIKDQKENPQNYRYKVVSVHTSSEKALLKEIKLHSKFSVGKNPYFYNKALQTSRKFLNVGGYTLTDVTRKRMSIASKLRASTEEFKARMSEHLKGNKNMLGYKWSEEAKNKVREASRKRNSGAGNPRAKPANIYNYETNELIASGVIITLWAKANGYTPQLLNKTARSNRHLPSSDNNPLQHKGVYAVYL